MKMLKMTEPNRKKSKKSEVLLPKYLLGKTLGIGSFGKVKLGQHVLTGFEVAVKILNLQKLNDAEVERVRREIKIMGRLSHPNIIRLYEVIEIKSKIYVVMEYMNHGGLYDYVIERGRLKEDEARHIFRQIIWGLEFCHLNKVVHRDLKPENLLLDLQLNVKLADFGLCNVMCDGHFLKTSCGSPNYAAPEVVSGKLYAGPEVDIWSCGIILYVLLCGRLPFDADNIPSLFKQIKNGLYTLPTHLSPLAKDLIIQILVVDPLRRFTIPQIREHPWFEYHLPQYLALPAEEARRGTKKDHDISYLHQQGGAAKIARNSLKQQQHCIDNRIASPKHQFPVTRHWTLGTQSPAHPQEIMVEILGVLQRLTICWKQIGNYNIRCKWIPILWSGLQTKLTLDLRHDPNEASASRDGDIVDPRLQNAIKFEIQLYKAPQKVYLIDLQRISGPPILFLDLCLLFFSQLQLL
ncbi:SNF1-related protein kinase catalytic subunit alpha KIN10 isoform X3 [Elaeis guineensis]|uniref:SNF1-related protein kinase catalytic subunit alpha KIN10 isoform X3 n=1 Tax=Elaeis guineensis var. tenera TaxID=51953 RepID=UPI00094F766C